MRMWMVDPKIMCRQHLMGEHVEMHMFLGGMKKGISMKGYSQAGLLEGAKLKERHNEIVKEMLARSYNHKSPMEETGQEYMTDYDWNAKVDRDISLQELLRRCPECRARFIALNKE